MTEIIENSDKEIMEVLAPEGIYFKENDGSQGFIPRADNTNPFNLTKEQIIQKEVLVKRIMLDFPEIDEGMVDFATMFYLDNPDHFEQIQEEAKNSKEPSRYTKAISDMKKDHEEINADGTPMRFAPNEFDFQMPILERSENEYDI
jgi:hypothetical protein